MTVVFILVGLCLLGFALVTRNTGLSPHRLPGVATNVASVSPRGSVTTSVSSVSPRGSVTVSWSGVSSPAVKDWLGLYQSGAANTAYLKWKYDSAAPGRRLNGEGVRLLLVHHAEHDRHLRVPPARRRQPR